MCFSFRSISYISFIRQLYLPRNCKVILHRCGFTLISISSVGVRFNIVQRCNAKKELFQKCTHLLYCSVLSLGDNVNTRRMLPPDMGSIFHIKKSMKYSGRRTLLCVLSKLPNLMLLTSSETKRTLFLFTNSAQRELVSVCTQSIHDRN